MKTRLLCAGAMLAVLLSSASWAQFAAGPEHEIFKQDVGVWDAKTTMWMGPDDSEVSEAVERNKMIGDLWLVSEFQGKFGGMDFFGHATMGYDAKTKKYVGTWVDSFNPVMTQMVGTYDKDSKTMTMMGSGVDPEGNPMKNKNVTVYKDDGSRVMTMYSQMPGSDEMTKALEIVYTKRKKEKKEKQ